VSVKALERVTNLCEESQELTDVDLVAVEMVAERLGGELVEK